MRIIIDTNICIYREAHCVVLPELQKLLSLLSKSKVDVLVHPLSINEVDNDRDEKRKEITKSKICTYPLLEQPPDPQKDNYFLKVVGESKNNHDFVDHNLIYSVYKNAVHFLITEDQNIHKKAGKLGISERVFTIKEAFDFFDRKFISVEIASSPAIKKVPMHNLNIDDPIFDSLKKDYKEFPEWWEKKSKEGREAHVFFKDDGNLGAILILKTEDESIPTNPPIERKERIKICLLKADYSGYIGELFIKMAIDYAIKNNIFEIYLTHFTEPDDSLVWIIEEYGFFRSKFKKEIDKKYEDIYIKRIVPDGKANTPLQLRPFYPSFYDGPYVNKFIVPIIPRFHDRLFTNYDKRQPALSDYFGNLIIEGNTIKKAYLCNSRIRKIRKGDILFFYRSRDKILTSLGIVENVHDRITDPAEIMRIFGKRCVYTQKEINEMVKKPTKIIIFRWHFYLENPLKITYLTEHNILSRAPQSIMEISHSKYLKIKRGGKINERFTVD